MKPSDESTREAHVRDLFTRIASRYDLMNRLMTGGRDVVWRRKMIRVVGLCTKDKMLDLGTGTGDLACEARRQQLEMDVTAADFTLGMMLTGRDWNGIRRCCASALHLPFRENSFSVVVSGYLMRNVADVDLALAEQARVLTPSGRIAILEMTRPRPNILSPIIHFYMHHVVPLIGWLVTGQKDAYVYLPDTTQNFLRAEELAEKMIRVGFQDVRFKILNFGTVAIHHGILPPTD